MSLTETERSQFNIRPVWRWVASLLLFVVGYIHFTLFWTMIRFNHVMGLLFLIAVVGSVVAIIGIVRNARVWGWGLGIAVAGGAALIRTLMSIFPGLAIMLMRLGRSGFPGNGRFSSGSFPFRQGAFPAEGSVGHYPPTGFNGTGVFRGNFSAHHFPHLGTFAGGGGAMVPISIVIEVAFVVIALLVIFRRQQSHRTG